MHFNGSISSSQPDWDLHGGLAGAGHRQPKTPVRSWDSQGRDESCGQISRRAALVSQRWRNSIQSAKTRLGADCGSDHELLIAKSRLKLKKVEKTIRPFWYELNQIPYDSTVEVRNRFK